MDGVESCDCQFGGRPRNQSCGRPELRPYRYRREAGSYRDFDDLFRDRAGNRFAVFLKALKVPLNRIADVGHRFLAGLALGDAPRKRGAFGHKYPVLIRRDDYTKFHVHHYSHIPAAWQPGKWLYFMQFRTQLESP
jgi:hypothetical protein